MLTEQISSTILMLWETMGYFFPLFLLLTVYQLSMTLFCIFKIFQTKSSITEHEKKSIIELGYANRQVSAVTVTLGLIGTFIGVILILTVSNHVVMSEIMSGLSMALTTTLAALLIAGIWGTFINNYLVRVLKRKYDIPDEHGYLRLIIKHLEEAVTLLNEINDFNKSNKSEVDNTEITTHSSNGINKEIQEKFFTPNN